MSDFSVDIVEIEDVWHHPNADSLDMVRIGGYHAIVLRDQYSIGEKVIYIPEQAIVPENILETLGLKGKLSGAGKDRVKAIRLRGIVSQGLIAPLSLLDKVEGEPDIGIGTDVAGRLGIIKYDPSSHIPSQLRAKLVGEIAHLPAHTFKYDINNIQKYQHIFSEGENVVFTEKIHGTFCAIGVVPGLEHPDLQDGNVVVFSKGLGGSRGCCFKFNDYNRRNNLYVRTSIYHDIPGRIKYACKELSYSGQPVYVFGEIFGKGMQDLEYDCDVSDEKKIGYRVFDVCVGTNRSFLGDDALERFLCEADLPRCPVLYRGPFSMAMAETYRDGLETVSGKGKHMREGIVISPLEERMDYKLGRVKLKFVSPDYLLRKKGTELE